MKEVSAGLLMWRRRENGSELFLVHYGGPFWKNKDEGAWSVPKGRKEEGETDLLEVAKREFHEETGFDPKGDFVPLGAIKRNDGKVVWTWAFEGDCDPKTLKSNTTFIEWPPKSGKEIEIPEVDRGEFFDIETAKRKITPYQLGIIEAFEKLIE